MTQPFKALRSSFMILSAGLLITTTACKKNDDPATDNTIGGIVTATGDFSTLNAAVTKANLGATLSGTGPFTVFAPNNAAFTASGITAATLGVLSAEQVSNILLYHTLPTKVMASEVPAGPNAAVATANGANVYVTRNGSGVFVNGIKVIQADVAASNGVVHVLEKVLMPAGGNLVQVAQADTSFSFLVAAVLRASEGSTNVAQVLSGAGPFTVFAPTNNAFRAAGFANIAAIQATAPNTLAGILTYHVVAGRVFSSDLSNGAQPATVNGGTVTIGLTSGATVKGNSNPSPSNIVATNVMATNGVVHVIDRVLLP